MVVLIESMEEKQPARSPKKDKKKELLLAQDTNYARNLSDNDEKVRKRSLKYLKKYLQQRSDAKSLSAENLQVLWKGLFYSMWMSDKPLVQEECAENIAHLIHALPFDESMLFFKEGLIALQNEWIGIDQLRLDKFLMFVRRLLRQALFVLKKYNFKKQCNKVFAKVLEDTVLSVTKLVPLGLFMHVTEIYLEELAKVSDGKMDAVRLLDFINPYITKLAFATDKRVIEWTNKFIFTHLMKQHKLGIEYEEKYKVWKAQGFAGSINQIQKVVVDDAENEESEEEPNNETSQEKPLDPRAGRVDVELPPIYFVAKDIAEALVKLKDDSRTSKTTRNHLKQWSERFLKLHNGQYPLGVKKLESKKRKDMEKFDTNVTKAAKRLLKFEEKLLADSNKRKRGDSESQEELEIDIPNKKIKKDIDNQDSTKLEKLKKKQKNKQDKINEPERMQKKIEHSPNEDGAKIKKKKLKQEHIEAKKDEVKAKLKNKLKKKLKKTEKINLSASISDDDYNYCFERNSGIWYVTPEPNEPYTTAQSPHVLEKLGLVPNATPSKGLVSNVTPSKNMKNNVSEFTESVNDVSLKRPIENGKTNATCSSKKQEKKFKNSTIEAEQIISSIRGKTRTSLNFLTPKQKSTPKSRSPRSLTSPKKVVINTKLNVSQEIDDHIMQVISSPQVPWDSSKKPGKPLLKTPVKASPINPFYKLKMF